ncbi:SsgA family sporulation/cell division regulator [Streptomyces sp. NPDC003554]
MDHLAAMDDEFDALLDASSLGAPHVVAETRAIPATARHRLAQAARRRQGSIRVTNEAPALTPANEELPDDGRTSASTDLLHASQDDDSAQRPLLYIPCGSGKSVIAAAFTFLSGSLCASTREPNEQSWIESATAFPILRDLRSSPTYRPVMTFVRRISPQYERTDDCRWDASGREKTSSLSLVASECNCAGDESKAEPLFRASFAPTVCLDVHPLFAPDTSGWPGTGNRLQDLQHLVEPLVCLATPVCSPGSSGSLAGATPPAILHVARFVSHAHTAVDSGLFLPRVSSALERRYPAEETRRREQFLRQQARFGRAKLWQATIDGTRELYAELRMSFHGDERESLALTSSLHTRLTYRASDPYAVEARFRAGDEDETMWVFARDLLRNGLERRSGLGDVTVWPGIGVQGDPRVFVRLSSPEGKALLSATKADLQAFLDATGNLVDYGAEHQHLVPALEALEATIGELARPGRRD